MKLTTMRRKIAILISSSLIYLSSGGLALAGNATLSISPATGTFNKGCDFNVDLILDTGGADTDGTDAILFFDATRLNAKSITSGTIYSDYPGNSIDAQSGKITISGLSSVSQAFKGSGKLATISFSVVETAPVGATQLKFDFDPNDKTKTTDSNVVERGTVADVLNQVTNGNFTVGSGTSCTGGTTTPGGKGGTSATGSATPAPGKLPAAGDASFTWVFATIGGAFTLFGILGLAWF